MLQVQLSEVLLQMLIEPDTKQLQRSLEPIQVQLIALTHMNAEMMLHVILTDNRLHSQAGLQLTNVETCTAIYIVRSRILMAITGAIQTGLTNLSTVLEIATSMRDRQIISLQGIMLLLLETISSHREAHNLHEVRNLLEARSLH